MLAAWLTLFTVGTDLFVVSPLLPWIAADLGITPGEAGFAVTAFGISYMVGAPLLGRLADRNGRNRVLAACLFGFAAANLLTALAGGFAELIAARLFAGAMAAGISPSVYALIGQAAPPGRRARWLSIAVSGLLTSLVLATPLGGLAGAYWCWNAVFAIIAAASLALIGAHSMPWRPAPARLPQTADGGSFDVAAAAPQLSLTVLWSTALYGVYTYIGAGLDSLGVSPPRIAATILLYGLGAVLGNLLGGRLADRFGTARTTGLALLGLPLALLLLRLALADGAMLALGFALVSLVAQLFFPAQQASLAKAFPVRAATVLALNNSALFLGISLGSLIGGQAMIFGFATDLTLCAGIAMLSWPIKWPRLLGRRGTAAQGQTV